MKTTIELPSVINGITEGFAVCVVLVRMENSHV